MSIYTKLRSILSKKNKGRLSKLMYYSNLKPRINKKESPFKKGIIVFSADFEMAWAFRYSKTLNEVATKTSLEERKNLPKLLSLFEKFNIPVTWATVGHLFLKECEKKEGKLGHYNLIRPNYFENRNWKYGTGDWYDHDPCTNCDTNPEWYAPDLIDLIIKSKIKHEIACHTFSHIDCTYQNCTIDLLDMELKECIKLAKEKDIDLKSFVFPGGTLGNFETIKENGFYCYRKPMKNHIDLPYIDKYGLIAIPSSLGLDKDPYDWSIDFHIKIIKKFIKKTIKSKKVCHFWFHPSMNTWYIENILPVLLQMIANEIENGNVEVLTMKELSNKIINND